MPILIVALVFLAEFLAEFFAIHILLPFLVAGLRRITYWHAPGSRHPFSINIGGPVFGQVRRRKVADSDTSKMVVKAYTNSRDVGQRGNARCSELLTS